MNSKSLVSACTAAVVLSFAAMQAFALPSSLTHRWSFNTNDKDEITGADPASRFGSRSISGGKVHFLGNSWGGGSLNLGIGLLGSGDATVEIWATQDAVRNKSIIFTYSNGGYGSWPSYEACMQWTAGTDINTDTVWLKNSSDKFVNSSQAAPYTLGTEYHIAMTLHDNGDGSTSVYWQKRNAATGVLEASGSGTASGWTLSALTAASANLAIGVYKHSSIPDACASYNEVRVWNKALSVDQLKLNAKNGPDKIEMLPDSLAHRWSFNADDFPKDHNLAFRDTVGGVAPQARWGTVDGNKTGPLEIESGKLKFVSNGWGGGSMDLGSFAIQDDATIELWASYDVNRYSGVMFEYGNPNNAYGQTGSQVTDAITYYFNQQNTANDLLVARKAGSRVLEAQQILQPAIGTMYHFSFTFRKSGSDTVVAWSRRNAATGAVEASGTQTVAGWTLADIVAKTPSFSIAIAKNQNYLGSYSRDANATYDEIRVWNGVLSDDQLTANVFMGPDVAAPSTVVGAAGFGLAPGATFRVTSDFATAGAVTLGEGSKLQFTEAATFSAGSFVLPAGTSIADHVDADAESFNVSVSGSTITVTRKSTVPVTASWIGSGSVTDSANWDCYGADGFKMPGVLPAAVTAVTIFGNALNLQAPADSNFKAASIAIGACTLAADCDWRGFPVTPSIASGSVNLNGRKLYLPSLADGSGAKFTGAGELHLDVASGNAAAFADFGVTGHPVEKAGAGDLAVSGTMPVGNGGVGAFTNSLGGTTVNYWMSIGHGSSGTGSVSVPGGTLTVKDSIHVGYNGGRGTLDVCGGTVNANFSGKNIFVNNNSTLTARNGGKVQGAITVNGGSGSVRATGGSATFQGTVAMNAGTFAVSGGSAAITYWLSIGHGKNTSASASVANGSLSVGDTLYVGYEGTGAFDVGSGATVTANPRLVANAGTMSVHDGGTVVTPKFQDDAANRATSVTFDGGTLQATASNSDFIKGFDDFTIGTGGMTVDTAGKTLGVVGTTFKIAPGSTPAITLANGGSLSLAGATFVLSSVPAGSFVLAAAAPGSGSVFAGDLPAIMLADGSAYAGAAVRSADGSSITVVPVSGSVWTWGGAADSAFATAANWSNGGVAASSLEGASLLLPAGTSQAFTYVGWDPVVLASTTLFVDGAASFGDVGGFYLKTIEAGTAGRISYDPTKFTFRLVKPPSFASGAKIALAPKYAGNTKGRFLLMTWNEDALTADAAALTAVFDASSANGANPKVWAENLSGGGGRLWLDLDYGAAKQRVNVLCVGDSITHGNDGNELCGTGKNGGWGNWRTGLMKKLAAAGYEPVAKGHRWDQSHDICGATMPDEWISHAGAGGGRLWRGTIDQIENTLDQAGDVDFVLCKIGTNDMGAMEPTALYEVWTNLVWKVLRQKTAAKFIAGAVVDIAYNPTLNNRVVAYNSLVRNAIESGTFPAKRAYFADLYTPCYRYDGSGNEIQGAFYDDTVNKLHPDWPNNDKIADTYFAAIANALADDPSFVPGQAEAGIPTTSGAANNVPAAHLSGYRRARVFDVAAHNGENLASLGRVPYEDIGGTGAAQQNIGRVGYYIELKRRDDGPHQYHGLVRWLWVSMDAFGDKTLETMGVPLSLAKKYQGPATNLRVASNMPGVDSTAADASGVAGWLEFWPSSYLGNASGVSGAPGNTHGFDWNDACQNNASGYGSMQVHRLTPGETNPAQVLFAFNRWTAASGNYEIGIGNFSHVSLGSVDWTLASEGLSGSQRMTAAACEAARIEIWTMPKKGSMLLVY